MSAHVEQLACSACRTDIKRFQEHNFLVLGQLVIVGPGAHKKRKKDSEATYHS